MIKSFTMSGSEKLQALERFHAELRYYGRAPFSLGAAVPSAPHPFVAHFYPLAAGNERPNLGYSHSANPISQQSSAAALVALAASGCVGKNISSQLLQNFQNQSSKKNFERKEDNSGDLVPSSDGPPKKKIRHQFSVDSLSGTSPQSQHHFSHPGQQQNALIQYPGISGLAASSSVSAWQQFFNRFRNFDSLSNTSTDRSADIGNTSPPSFGKTREKSSLQVTDHSTFVDAESRNQRNHHRQVGRSYNCLTELKESGSNQFHRRQRGNGATTPSKIPKESPLCNSPVEEAYDTEMFEKSIEENSSGMQQQKYNHTETVNSIPPNGLVMRKNNIEDDSLKSTNDRCSSTSSDQSRDDLSERKRKKRLGSVGDTCPVCGITVRSAELEIHVQQEIEKLTKIPSEVKRKHMNSRRSSVDKRSFRNPIATSSMSSTGKKYSELSAKSTQNNRFKTYQKVRSNRHERLNMKVGQGLKAQGSMANSYNFNMAPFASNPIWSASSSPWSPHLSNLPSSCPVCCMKLQGSLSDMHEHIGRCLRQRNVNQQVLDEDVDVDVVDVPPYVNGSTNDRSPDEERSNKSFGSEYEWCGQTRIRATSLVDKATLASSSGFYLVKPSEEESDRYLNVEADDTQAYGPTQYMEKNLVHPECASDPEKISCDNASLQQSGGSTPSSPGQKSSMADMVASLRGKIENLESETRSTRCMICMDFYKDPVASVQCWHVHCENCWMRALAVKKLCPQCNAITPPDKLRRIFL